MSHGANAGLPGAVTLLTPVKEKFPDIGWSDLIQVGGCMWFVGLFWLKVCVAWQQLL